MSDNILKNLRLTVCAFQIIDSVDQISHKILPPADNFWAKCAELATILEIAELDLLPAKINHRKIDISAVVESQLPDYLELLTEPCVETFIGSILIVDAYPVQLHDTYFLDLNLRFNQENLTSEINIENVTKLNPQGCLLAKNLQSSLGQSLLLIVQPNLNFKDYQILADDCVSALLKDAGDYYSSLLKENKLTCQTGRLFGSPIFEYDRIDKEVVHLHDRCHILVWFHCFPQTSQKAIDLYKWLRLLLYSRHKIIHAYYESRCCKKDAFQLYRQIEAKIAEFKQLPTERNERLEYLKKQLIEVPKLALDYHTILREIKEYYATIEMNIYHYHQYLKVLETARLLGDDLTFWQEFGKKECEKFKNQLQIDINYLLPEENLFDRLIGSIRGIVEIEQAESDRDWEAEAKKSDRQLQSTIAIVGVGIGVAGVTAIAFSENQKSENPSKSIQTFPENPSFHPIIKSISISLIFGFIAAFGAWGSIYLWRLFIQPWLAKNKN